MHAPKISLNTKILTKQKISKSNGKIWQNFLLEIISLLSSLFTDSDTLQKAPVQHGRLEMGS